MSAVSSVAIVAVSVCVALVASRRSRAVRFEHLVGPGRPRRAAVTGSAAHVVEALGRAVRALAHRPAGADLDRRAGAALVVGAAGALVAWPLALPLAAGAWVFPELRTGARRRREMQGILAELPETIDLLRLAVGAGYTVRLAIDAVCAHGQGSLIGSLTAAVARADAGERLADCLADLDLGDDVRQLLDALVDTERHGVALGVALDRVAADARHRRRVRGEQAARVLSVKLLFPLVCCVLPAFVLVTVVPLFARSLPSLAP